MDSPPPRRRFEDLLLWTASIALLSTVALDTTAVVLRQFGRSLPGSTEVVQFAIVPATAIALLMATLLKRHASVHVLTDRLGPRLRAASARLADASLLVLCLLLAAASVWLLADTRHEPERSDLLGLPLAPLRVIWLAALVGASGISAWRLVRPGHGRERDHDA